MCVITSVCIMVSIRNRGVLDMSTREEKQGALKAEKETVATKMKKPRSSSLWKIERLSSSYYIRCIVRSSACLKSDSISITI